MPTSPELRLGLAAWTLFILGTCAYCLTYQAFVAAISPDVGRTILVALREWGAWSLLAPLAMRLFRTSHAPRWQNALLHCLLLALTAASLPIAVDQITGARDFGASLALFWPRNLAMAIGFLILGRVFQHRPAPAARSSRSLRVSKGADQCLLLIDDIQHVSAAGNYVDIRARDQNYLLRATMTEVEALLPPHEFVRIHRSHLVRVREIERIRLERSGSGTVHLRGGAELPISRNYRAKLPGHTRH